jgi:hypothetical protein
MMNPLRTFGVTIVLALASFSGALEAFPEFATHDINPEAGTGLAITVADIEGDGDLDIVGVSSEDVAWYENPSWERHLIAPTIRNSNVCVAPQDLDGDGLPELALGADWQFNNTQSGGSLHLLHRGEDCRQPWKVVDLLEEPTLHRIRWAYLDGNGQPELIVAPLKGKDSTPPYFRETGIRLLRLLPGEKPLAGDWEVEVIDDTLRICHNIWPVDWNRDGKQSLLAASMEGITEFRLENGDWKSRVLTKGNPDPWPRSGAGEIKVGWDREGTPMMATVEPWHGTQTVVYRPGEQWSGDPGVEWKREVVDDHLAGGHAVAWADFDGDGDQELLMGYRENAGAEQIPGLNIYDYRRLADGTMMWEKRVLDPGGMATEDALAADLNGDGRPDVAAYGRATHNVRYYENLGE